MFLSLSIFVYFLSYYLSFSPHSIKLLGVKLLIMCPLVQQCSSNDTYKLITKCKLITKILQHTKKYILVNLTKIGIIWYIHTRQLLFCWLLSFFFIDQSIGKRPVKLTSQLLHVLKFLVAHWLKITGLVCYNFI